MKLVKPISASILGACILLGSPAQAATKTTANISQPGSDLNTLSQDFSDKYSDSLDSIAREVYLDNEFDSQGNAYDSLMLASNTSDTDPASEAATTADAGSSAEADMAALAKASANPLSSLWLLWLQNDTTHIRGDILTKSAIADGHKNVNSTKFQPVMSFPIDLESGKYNLILRPVFQYQSVPLKKDVGKLLGMSPEGIVADKNLSEIAKDPWGRTNGFGDTALLALFGPSRDDGLIWGAGITQIFPTAEHDVLGQEKWQAGPAVLLMSLAPNPGGWNIGALVQHWWSYAGDDDRADTSLTNIQYFLNYRLSETELIGMTPNITYNWKADDSDDALTLPIGLGYSNVVKIGKLPVRIAAEVQYNVISPDNMARDWNLRFIVAPIVPRLF